ARGSDSNARGPGIHRVPVRERVADGEAGLTCLAMVLAAHGRDLSIGELRRDAGRTARETKPAGLIAVAARHGLNATATIVTTAQLEALPTPSILQRSDDQYLVFE